jgi:hypothetical protein
MLEITWYMVSTQQICLLLLFTEPFHVTGRYGAHSCRGTPPPTHPRPQKPWDRLSGQLWEGVQPGRQEALSNIVHIDNGGLVGCT